MNIYEAAKIAKEIGALIRPRPTPSLSYGFDPVDFKSVGDWLFNKPAELASMFFEKWEVEEISIANCSCCDSIAECNQTNVGRFFIACSDNTCDKKLFSSRHEIPSHKCKLHLIRAWNYFGEME